MTVRMFVRGIMLAVSVSVGLVLSAGAALGTKTVPATSLESPGVREAIKRELA